MKEQERVPAGGGGGDVHLPGAACRCRQDFGDGRGLRDRSVVTPSVSDQDFAEGRMVEPGERRTDVLRFVEGGNDDRDGHSCGGGAGGWGGGGGRMRRPAGLLAERMEYVTTAKGPHTPHPFSQRAAEPGDW